MIKPIMFPQFTLVRDTIVPLATRHNLEVLFSSFVVITQHTDKVIVNIAGRDIELTNNVKSVLQGKHKQEPYYLELLSLCNANRLPEKTLRFLPLIDFEKITHHGAK